MKLTAARFFLSLFILLSLTLPPLEAQVNVSVSPLARVVIGPVNGLQGNAMVQIVSGDLSRTGMISPVGAEPGDFQATGSVTEAGLTGRLVNLKTGAEVFQQSFSGPGRAAAHQFADAITQAVTGWPGIASSKIAFIATATGSKELYLADIDGANARTITHDHVICASPAYSWDGRKLAYTSYKSGYPDVYLVNIASGSRTRIAYFPGINSGPCFSPDGSQIALTLSKDGNPEIYTLPLNGGAPVR
ncbi:MAG TPA: biopolymer transporter Tol, partial [Candidatus Methylacidiphilales bacterium]|nr:biopolymer transporter Tol [Candidatus Methylacidiphilales bacterium]